MYVGTKVLCPCVCCNNNVPQQWAHACEPTQYGPVSLPGGHPPSCCRFLLSVPSPTLVHRQSHYYLRFGYAEGTLSISALRYCVCAPQYPSQARAACCDGAYKGYTAGQHKRQERHQQCQLCKTSSKEVWDATVEVKDATSPVTASFLLDNSVFVGNPTKFFLCCLDLPLFWGRGIQHGPCVPHSSVWALHKLVLAAAPCEYHGTRGRVEEGGVGG